MKPIDNDLLLFILKTKKIDYALFDSSLNLINWSAGLKTCLPEKTKLIKGIGVADIFSELCGYEDILGKIQKKQRSPLILDRIEKHSPYQSSTLRLEQLTEYYSLQAYPYNEYLLIVICDVTEDGDLERRITQRRNELDILNIQLIDNLKNTNDELSQAYITTLEGWAKALEIRDVETEGHSQRVVELTKRLIEAIGIDKEEQKYYGYGALLHDIGKMGIPDSILKKNQPLSKEEWDIMRSHPIYAFNLLSPIRYLNKALDIPHYHHERWDGRGYPEGLKGEKIPLSARIFSVVDVYDAITSSRPYRKAWTKEEALRYIRDRSGIRFDPKVVEYFFSIMK